jgi:hypothetical protein
MARRSNANRFSGIPCIRLCKYRSSIQMKGVILCGNNGRLYLLLIPEVGQHALTEVHNLDAEDSLPSYLLSILSASATYIRFNRQHHL